MVKDMIKSFMSLLHVQLNLPTISYNICCQAVKDTLVLSTMWQDNTPSAFDV